MNKTNNLSINLHLFSLNPLFPSSRYTKKDFRVFAINIFCCTIRLVCLAPPANNYCTKNGCNTR